MCFLLRALQCLVLGLAAIGAIDATARTGPTVKDVVEFTRIEQIGRAHV